MVPTLLLGLLKCYYGSLRLDRAVPIDPTTRTSVPIYRGLLLVVLTPSLIGLKL